MSWLTLKLWYALLIPIRRTGNLTPTTQEDSQEESVIDVLWITVKASLFA